MNFKHYIRMMLVAVSLSVSSLLSAQTFVLSESFEEGIIPSGWAQEHIVGQQDWIVESTALDNPDGAAQGKFRAALRNTTKQRIGFKTRLILPSVDITGITKPVISFSFAQAPWAGDFDTLRVLYRATPTDEWIVLVEYDRPVSLWRAETVELGTPTATAQVAFEGTDNLGRGIVIDNITIRPLPECLRPSVLIDGITDTEATIWWNGSYDTKEFHIRVSEEQLSEIRLNSSQDEFKAEPYDLLLHGSLTMLQLENLKLGTEYHVYVRALCGDENSDWSLETSFTTLQKVVLPYQENFDLDLTGLPSYGCNWQFFTSYDKAIPYINTNAAAYQLASYSETATTCLTFADYNGVGNPIPEGTYAYAVSPEILTDDISSLQVSFVGKCSYSYSGRIIIGVMTDPTDRETFQPIDTVIHDKSMSSQFVDYIVPLTDAKKDAKYVALYSDGKERNTFYIDNLVIEPVPPCAKADGQTFKVEAATTVTVDWNSNGAIEGDVLFVTSLLDPRVSVDTAIAKLDASEYVLAEAADKPAIVSGLTPETSYYVYIRNKCGEHCGAWSRPKQVVTPGMATVPTTYDFEIDEKDPDTYNTVNDYYKLSKGLTVKGTGTIIQNSKDVVRNGSWSLYMQMDASRYSYISLPSIDNLKETRIEFFGRVRNRDKYGYIIIGVMKDIYDESTFTPVDTLRMTSDCWTRFVIDLDNYDAEGKFFTFYSKRFYEHLESATCIYIDDLSVSTLPACKDPKTINVEPGINNVTLSWDDNGAEVWQVRLSEKEAYDSLTKADYQWVVDKEVTAPKTEIGMLKGNHQRYFAYLRSICKQGGQPNEWLGPVDFYTECYPKQPLPYTMDLAGAYAEEAHHIIPCVETNYVDKYPSILSGSEGNQLHFKTYTKATQHQSVVLPEMELSINELSLDITLGASTSACILEVGAVKSPDDMESFSLLKTLTVPSRGMEKFRLYFSSFTTDYKHIAFRTPLDTTFTVYVLDAVVSAIDGCAEMSEITLRDVQPDRATFSWSGDMENQWDVVVSRTEQTPESLLTAMAQPGSVDAATIPFAKTVDNNPCTVDGLNFNTAYYFYVRSKCSPEGGPWSTGFLFRTNCGTLTLDKLAVEDYESYQPGDTTLCWSGSVVSGSLPSVTGDMVHSGTKSLYITSDIIKTDADAVFYTSPSIDLSAEQNTIDKYQLSFWGYAPYDKFTVNEGRVDVGIQFVLGDGSTFAGVDSVYNYGVWHYYTIPFDNYVGDMDENMGSYVSITSGFDQPNKFYIDDLKVELAPSCLAPRRISLTGIDDRGATVNWEADQTDVVIRLCDHQLSHDEIQMTTIEGVTEIPVTGGVKSYKLENMASRTRFYIYVGAECDGKMRWSSPVSFETACPVEFSTPYYESFDKTEGTGANYKPDCWTTFHYVANPNDARIKQYPSIEPGGKKGNCLRFFTNNLSQVSYAMMQKFDTDISKCLMTFFAKYDGSETPTGVNAIEIGVVKDRDANMNDIIKSPDEGGFMPIDTVEVDREYKKYYVPLSSYKPEYGEYLAFRMNYNLGGRSTYLYLDELTIDVAPDCLEPEELKFVSVSENAIEFSLVEVGGSTAWEYACMARGNEPTDTDAKPIQTAQHKITGLQPMTDYDVYVRSVNSTGDKSKWVGPLTARTYTSYVSSYDEAYIESFENVGDTDWNMVGTADANNWYIGTAVANQGSKALYISADGGKTLGLDVSKASMSYAYRTVYMPVGVYHISYRWDCAGKIDSDFAKVGLLPADAIVDGGSDRVIYPDGRISTFASELTPVMSVYALTGSEGWVTDTMMHVVYVKDEGYYNLTFYWENSKGIDARQASAAIDMVSISKVPCVHPMELVYTVVDHESVTLEWMMMDDSKDRTYEIFITDDASITDPTEHLDKNLYKGNNATEAKFRVPGLAEQSVYYAFVRSVCNSGKYYSIWSNRIMFKTTCSPVSPEILYGFEEKMTDAWPLGECFVSTKDGYDKVVLESNVGDGVVVARTGRNALFLSNGYSNYAAISLPQVSASLDDYQLTFWMRPIAANGDNEEINNNNYQGQDRSEVIVGTMGVAGDMKTFDTLSVCKYPYSKDEVYRGRSVRDDMMGNKYWAKFSVPLKGCDGKFITLAALGGRNYAYIDDVIIEPLTSCAVPTGIDVVSYTDTTATIFCRHAAGTQVEVSYSTSMDDIVSGEALTMQSSDTVVVLKGLASASEYYYAVRTICGGDEMSDRSVIQRFTTAHAVRFAEAFSANTIVPSAWSRVDNMLAEDIFAGQDFNHYVGITDTTIWSHVAINDFSSAHQMQYLSSRLGQGADASGHFGGWLITPSIFLPAGNDALLTFDLMVTTHATYSAPNYQKREGYSFMVIVSDDNGETWKQENSTVWNHEKANNDFYALTNEYENISVDMTKYAGNTIKVAFYIEARKGSLEQLDIHLDNVSLNSTVRVDYPEETHCATYDYLNHGFEIPVEEINAEGVNEFSRVQVSTTSALDTVYTVRFTVNPVAYNTIEASICEGDVYNLNGFTGIEHSGRYVQKCTGVNTCDSIVYLDLTVNAVPKSSFDTTFCEGSSVIWNGKEYKKEGTYTDTIALVGRCDSVVTMNLTMIDALYGAETHYVCQGKVLELDGEEYESDGSMETFEIEQVISREDYCDSIVIHTIVYAPVYNTVIEAAICDGERYTANGFNNITQEGSLTTPNKTQVCGCDSLVTLNLLVIGEGETTRTVERTITVNQLPYTFFSEIFGADTKAGDYTKNGVVVTSESGKCSMTVDLILHVDDGSGSSVDVVEVAELVLAPNPVRVGESIVVDIELTAAERNGLVVEVYNAAGAMVQRNIPDTNIIVIAGIDVEGVYVVRVIDGRGIVYYGKLIVK